MIFKVCIMGAFLSYLSSIPFYLMKKSLMGNILVTLGLILNIYALIMRGYWGGEWYVDLMTKEFYIVPAGLACIILILFFKGAHSEGRAVTFSLGIYSLIALLVPFGQVLPTLKMKVAVVPLFILTEAISASIFIAAASLAIVSLVSHTPGFRYGGLVIVGFIMFTICQIIGALWAYLGWSYPFSWSHRHLASASAWCMYAALIHRPFMHIHQKIAALCVCLGAVPMGYLSCFNEIKVGFMRIFGV
ncbi:MAG: cytochrome c biogenesis protein CcsA [Deltaproteobacteria bacterium]|nr:cytochrome c biogenesis protein CcsA [Deltaproteobacteria bacterium]